MSTKRSNFEQNGALVDLDAFKVSTKRSNFEQNSALVDPDAFFFLKNARKCSNFEDLDAFKNVNEAFEFSAKRCSIGS